MMLKFIVSLSIFASLFAIVASATESDVERWNAGVDAYRSGDTTNALAVLRPLQLSQTHGARAAEVVAKIAYDKAHTMGSTNALQNLEESAIAAQIALRDNPRDSRRIRNFARATDGLLALRDTTRINNAIAKANGKNPANLLRDATHDVRKILDDVASAKTNVATVAIANADRGAKELDRLADVWIPVKEAICKSVTNENDAATITLQVDQARERTLDASVATGDFSPDAYSRVAEVEQDFTRFMKMTISPPDAIREDFLAQTNAFEKITNPPSRTWQQDALDLTRVFRQRFPEWAREYEQQAQSDTNKPPFKAEDQAKIDTLSLCLEQIQLGCIEKPERAKEEESMKLINEIIELLPKDKNGGQSQNQNNQNQQQNQQKQQQNQDQQQQNQQDQLQNQNDEEQSKEEEKENDAEENAEEKEDDREVDAVLKKAQERSDEHEAEKKARMRKAPLPPNTRDW